MAINEPVLWATNRDRTATSFGAEIHPDGAATVHSGRASLVLDRFRAYQTQIVDADDVTVAELGLQTDLPGAEGFARALTDVTTRDGLDVIVYLHGYDTRFEESMFYAAQLRIGLDACLARLQANPSLRASVRRVPKGFVAATISWPSDGIWTRYFGDRNEAKRAHPLIGAVFASLEGTRRTEAPSPQGFDREDGFLRSLAAAHGSAGRVHMVAQSMGAFIMGHGLPDFVAGRADEDITPFLGQIFLSGADVDTNAFERDDRLARLSAVADQVTVYFNPDDDVGLAGRIANLRRRMSHGGLRNPAAAPDIAEVDVSATVDRDRDRFGHYYARINPIVQNDMLLGICGLPSNRIPGRQRADHPNAFRL